MDKLDFKKVYKDLYLPGNSPVLIEVPPIQYITVDGIGDPSGEAYHQALELLYSLSFTIKMSKMGDSRPSGYFEYIIPPLEGLWDCSATGFNPDRNTWHWTSMIRQPDFVTEKIFNLACDQVAKKKPYLNVSNARLQVYEEKLCVHIMHIGPYTTEKKSIDQMAAFIKDNHLTDESGIDRRHHEIYLSDPHKTKPEKLRTVLRHPVSKK